MHVLIVKTSSMGDVLHTLPALTDAMHAIPDIKFDWVVEEGFAQIPSWPLIASFLSRFAVGGKTGLVPQPAKSAVISKEKFNAVPTMPLLTLKA